MPRCLRAAARRSSVGVRPKDLFYGLVELSDALEAGPKRYIRGREVGRLQQGPGRLRALCPGQSQSARADLGHQYPVQLPLAVAQAAGQAGHTLAVDDPVQHQLHRPGRHVGSAKPLGRTGRGVGPATQAGAKAGLLSRGRRGIKADIFPLGGEGRAAGAAVNMGCLYGSEEPPVEARVAALDRPITPLEIVHLWHGAMPATLSLAVFGHPRRRA